MSRPIPDSIARAVQPFLGQVVEHCSDSTLTPGDFVLLLGKYSAEQTLLVPRSNVNEILDRATTPARRRKIERLLASAHGRHDLLVMVFAGDHVEGHSVRVPTVAPKATRPLAETALCECGCGEAADVDFHGHYYKNACLERMMTELRAAGVPIEQDGTSYRLAPSTKVSFRLDDPEGEKH